MINLPYLISFPFPSLVVTSGVPLFSLICLLIPYTPLRAHFYDGQLSITSGSGVSAAARKDKSFVFGFSERQERTYVVTQQRLRQGC